MKAVARIRSSAAILMWLVGMSGCFADSVASGAEGCPDGDAGCPCFGNGTCNSDLLCTQDKCLPPGCQDGQSGCLCMDGGVCDDGLVCEDDLCNQAAGSTSTSASATDTTSTTADLTTSSTTEGATDATSHGTGTRTCDVDDGADACSRCTNELCCEELIACTEDEDCACWFGCALVNAPIQECTNTCGVLPNTLIEVQNCQRAECVGDCDIDQPGTGTGTSG